jgi:RND family efflux transporter MFP subunit
LKSEKQAAVGAKNAGRVLKVYVREGQAVNRDDVLAELEHADIDQTLEAMKASLTATDAARDAMRLSWDKAKSELAEVEAIFLQDDRDFSRVDQLFKTGQVSTAEHEQAESKRRGSRSRRDSMTAAVAVCQARLKEAEARCIEAQARLRETEQQRRNLFVHAPFKGIVISKEAEEGESIMPGGMGAASGRGSVVTLADLLHLEVETDVKEDYVGRVKRDQAVSVSVDAVPERRFSGRVRTIIPMGDRAKGTVKVKVQLNEAEVKEVNDPDAELFTLFPEMAATVHFLGDGKRAASGPVVPLVTAPAAAVQTDGNSKFVWKVVDDRVQRVAIETDEPKDGRVIVRRGLKGGERLVIEPPANLQDGARVKVAQ